jgi:hypothetical protein
VTLLARIAERGDIAVSEVSAMLSGAELEPGVADPADLDSIHSFAESYLTDHDAFDVLMDTQA